jgi:YbbR domain-containing protein
MPGTPSAAPRPTNPHQRRVIAAFGNQIWLKVTAVFLAVVLWFVVNAKEPEIQLVPVRFTPVLDSSLVLRERLPQVQALVAGSPKQLIKLTSSLPSIRREITADAPDTLVLDLRPEDVILPDGVDAVVREVEPRSLTLRFESTWTRRVPVRSAITVATSNGPPGPLATIIDPLTVEVSGPRHLVARIQSVKTLPTTISYPDSLPHLVDLDTTGLGPGVRIRPPQVRVSVTLGAPR